MADYEQFKWGIREFPLPAVANPAKVVCNPGVAGALDFYTAMFQKHLGPYWDALCPTLGLAEYVGKVVGEKVPYDPGMYGVDATRKLPLLCLYRTQEAIREHSRAWTVVDSQWTLQWVLPPCTAAQYLQFSQLLVAARAVVCNATEMGYDPSYLAGDNVWLASLGEGFTIGMQTVEYGHWVVEREKTSLRFPCVTMVLRVTEREQAVPGLLQFVTFDTTVDVRNAEGSETVVETTQVMT